MRVLAVLALWALGCGPPHLADGAIVCGTDGHVCPPGKNVCKCNLCWTLGNEPDTCDELPDAEEDAMMSVDGALDGTPPTDGTPPPDMGPLLDGPPPTDAPQLFDAPDAPPPPVDAPPPGDTLPPLDAPDGGLPPLDSPGPMDGACFAFPLDAPCHP